MSDTDSGAAPYTATLKSGKGYEASWLVLRADTEAEMLERLDGVSLDLLSRTVEVATVFQNLAAGGSAAAPSNAGSAPSSQPAPAAQQSAPPAASPAPSQQDSRRWHPEGRKCGQCGAGMFYQEGISKATQNLPPHQQKTWKAYKCDGRGTGHDVEWVR